MNTTAPLGPPFDSTQAALLEWRWWLVGPLATAAGIGIAGLVLGPVAIVLAPGVVTDVSIAVVLFGSMLMSFVPVVALLVVSISGWATRMRLVRVTASGAGLFVNGALMARRDALTAGYLVPHDRQGSMCAEVHRRFRGRLDVVVRDATEGRALLRALGLDAIQRDAVFRTASRLMLYSEFEFLFILGFWVALFGGAHRNTFVPLLVWVGVWVYARIFAAFPAKLHVGPDGIEIRWMGYRRFVAYREIKAIGDDNVAQGGRGSYWTLNFPLVAGGRVRIPVARAANFSDNEGKARLILERIKEASESQARGEIL